MRFSSVLISTLAALATAAPNSLTRRDDQTAVTEAIQFAVLADDCDVFQCAVVVASAACIAGAIALGPAGVPELVGCVSGGAGSICPCAGCIDALGNFLKDNGVCPK